MPTYEYVCTKCDERLEVLQSFTDDALTKCPNCKGKLRKVFSPVGVVFKGSGFYKTDSRGSKSASTAASSSSSTDSSKSSDSSSDSSSSTDSSSSSSSSSESTTTTKKSDSSSSSGGSDSTGGGSKVA